MVPHRIPSLLIIPTIIYIITGARRQTSYSTMANTDHVLKHDMELFRASLKFRRNVYSLRQPDRIAGDQSNFTVRFHTFAIVDFEPDNAVLG